MAPLPTASTHAEPRAGALVAFVRAHAARCAPAVLAALAATATPVVARAQAADPPAGSRVRLVLPDRFRQAPATVAVRSLTGELARATADTLYVRLVDGVEPIAVPRAVVRRLLVSRGVSRTSSAVEQALMTGFGLGALTLAVTDGVPHQGRRVLGFTLAGVGFGAVLGAVSPYERWRPWRR